MATYYASSNNQRDGAPMAYIPGSYPEAQILSGNVMMYMNNGSFADNLGQNSQQQSNCIEIHSIGTSDSTPQQHGIFPNLNSWRDNFAMHSVAGPSSILNSGQNLQGQGLSLSLGMQIPSAIHVPYRNPDSGLDSFLSPSLSMMGEEGGRNGEEQPKNAEFLPPGFSGGNQDLNKGDFSSYGMTSVARCVPSSKYLKAAQQLLDEVVNVKKALKRPDNKINQVTEEHNNSKEDENQSKNVSSDPQDNLSKELSNGERQELQNKLTKLLSMLDEVERRYKQYYHQMQIVVSSFNAIAGSGAAKPYTALALQTISCHFRCLRDAISGQIQAIRKSLGEPEISENSKGIGITRLRYVDQQLRQQRALQQLGMMQQHAWRPQRGLPESSVSILRAWLFEHFLHPYPKDSDKIMLARQTGLTRSQVSNWFINARVRLWKPMVEEMYKEEIGDVDLDSISSSENAAKALKRTSEDRGEELQQTSTSAPTEKHNTGPLMGSQTNNVHDLEIAGSATRSDFQNVDASSEYRFMAAAAGAYHMPDVGRFGGRSGVSLTLGLQHCEGDNLPMSAVNNHGFMRGGDLYGASGSSETADFECLNPGNRQNRYSSSHMLHDFVA